MAGRWGFDITGYSVPDLVSGGDVYDYADNFFAEQKDIGHVYSQIIFSESNVSDPFPAVTSGGWEDPVSLTDLSSVVPEIFDPMDLISGSTGSVYAAATGDTSGFTFPLPEVNAFRYSLAIGEWFNTSGAYPSDASNAIRGLATNNSSNGYGFEVYLYENNSQPSLNFKLFRVDQGEDASILNNIISIDINQTFIVSFGFNGVDRWSLYIGNTEILYFIDDTYSRSVLEQAVFIIGNAYEYWASSIRGIIITDGAHPVLDSINPAFISDVYKIDSSQNGGFISYSNSNSLLIDLNFDGLEIGTKPTNITSDIQGPLNVIDLYDLSLPGYVPIEVNFGETIGSINDATPVTRGFVFESDIQPDDYGVNLSGLTKSFAYTPKDFDIEAYIDEVSTDAWSVDIGAVNLTSGYGLVARLSSTGGATPVGTLYIAEIIPTGQNIIATYSHSFDGFGPVMFSYRDGIISYSVSDSAATPANIEICSIPYRHHVQQASPVCSISNVLLKSFRVFGWPVSITNSFGSIVTATTLSDQIMQFSFSEEVDLLNFNRAISEFVQLPNQLSQIDRVVLFDDLEGFKNEYGFSGSGGTPYVLKSFVDFAAAATPTGLLPEWTNGDGTEDPVALVDHSTITSTPYTFQEARIENGVFRPTAGTGYDYSCCYMSIAYDDPVTVSLAFGGWSGTTSTASLTDDFHLKMFFGTSTYTEDLYYLKVQVNYEATNDFVFTSFEFGTESYGVETMLAHVDLPYQISANDILTIRHEYIDGDANVTAYFNNFKIFTQVHPGFTPSDFGVILRQESDTEWIPSVSWMSWSDEFYDPDPLGFYRYMFVYNYFYNEMISHSSYPYIFGPNIKLYSSGTINDQLYNDVGIDSRLIAFINNFFNSSDHYDGLSISGNYSDADWAGLVPYLKSLLPQQGEPIIVNIIEGATPIEIPNNLDIELNISDMITWPASQSFYAEGSIVVTGNVWYFRGIMKFYGSHNNIKLFVDKLSKPLLRKGVPPTIEIYDNDSPTSLIFSDSLPLAGNFLNIGTLGSPGEEKVYDFVIYGRPGEKGNGQLSLTLSGDTISSNNISDNIVVISGG